MTFTPDVVDRKRLPLSARKAIVLRQNALCACCGAKLWPGQVEFDHVQALVHGGDNSPGNFRAICRDCHKAKTRRDVSARDKGNRIALGGKTRNRAPMPGSRDSRWKRRMDGTVERRN